MYHPDHGCRRPSDCVVCNRDASQITDKELARRVAIELSRDASVFLGSDEVVARMKQERTNHLNDEYKASEGLCPCCGELIGDVPKCPICHSVLWRGDPCKSANTK